MQEDNFINKTSIAFAIISNEITPEIISKELDIVSTRFFYKGEKVTSKNSPTVGERPHNLWEIRSPDIISEKESLSPHINFLKEMLWEKTGILERYKNDSRMESIFWVSIETEDAGYGFDLQHDEIAFLNSISNRISISFISKESVSV